MTGIPCPCPAVDPVRDGGSPKDRRVRPYYLALRPPFWRIDPLPFGPPRSVLSSQHAHLRSYSPWKRRGNSVDASLHAELESSPAKSVPFVVQKRKPHKIRKASMNGWLLKKRTHDEGGKHWRNVRMELWLALAQQGTTGFIQILRDSVTYFPRFRQAAKLNRQGFLANSPRSAPACSLLSSSSRTTWFGARLRPA